MAGVEALRLRGIRRRGRSPKRVTACALWQRDNAASRCWLKMAKWCRSAGRAAVAWWMWSNNGQCLLHSSSRRGARRGFPSVCLSSRSRQYAGRMGAEWRGRSRDSSRRRRAEIAGICSGPENAASARCQHCGIEVHARSPEWLERIHHPRKPASRAANRPHFPRSSVCDAVLKNFSIHRIRATGIRTSTARIVVRATPLFLACPTTGRTLRCSTGLWTTTATRNITTQAIAVSMLSRLLARIADPSYSLHSEARIVHGNEASIRKAAQLLNDGNISR